MGALRMVLGTLNYYESSESLLYSFLSCAIFELSLVRSRQMFELLSNSCFYEPVSFAFPIIPNEYSSSWQSISFVLPNSHDLVEPGRIP